MFLEEPLEGQQGRGAQGIGGLVVAVASSPVGDATGGEGLRLWKGKHERGREGGEGRRAGHHGRAEGLKVTAADCGVKRLPVLSRVEGAGQVHVWDRPRRLHLRLRQQVQRLLQDGGLQVGQLHRAVGDGGGRQEGVAAAAEDGVGGRSERRLARSDGGRRWDGGLWLRGDSGGEAGMRWRHGDHREV